MSSLIIKVQTKRIKLMSLMSLINSQRENEKTPCF
jgi:hypothetical protein